MLSNYLTITLRNLVNNKVFSIINITGLAVGITCCTLLALYIQSEFSYEKHFEGADRIFRVTSILDTENGTTMHIPRTSPPVAMGILEEIPEVESATRVVTPPEIEQHLVRYGDKVFYEKKGYLVDSTFLDVFSFALREGNPTTALDAPSTVILSDKVARKIFGDKPALNESVMISSGWSSDTFRITGVLAPLPGKTHLEADFYISMNSKGWGQWINSQTNWSNNNFIFTYLRLKDHSAAATVVSKFAALLEKHAADEMRASGRRKAMDLQPLPDIHLFSNHFDYRFDLGTNGSILYVYVISAVALFILVIACINFMNLTTAKSLQRAGEVGVRKTMGASRNQLIRQFMGESFIIVLVSMVISVGLIQVSLPVFNALAGRALELDAQNWICLIAFLCAISLVTGLFAGSYPAFFLSSFQPAKALKNKRLGGGSSNLIRKGLVVVQFVIAITLIGSSAIIYLQLRFIQEKELGYNGDSILLIPLRTQEAMSNYSVLKKQFGGLSGVKTVTGATSFPSTTLLRDFSLYTEGSSMGDAVHHMVINVGEGYFNLLGIPIVKGSDFNKTTEGAEFGEPYNRIIVNRTSLKKLGIREDRAIGSRVMWSGRRMNDKTETTLVHEIVGVAEDFHYASLHNPIEPVAFFLAREQTGFGLMAVKVETGAVANTIGLLESVWEKTNPGTPFENQLLNDHAMLKYENEKKVSMIITSFTIIAILLSCLGLYGLSVYIGERKTREIGIRKVLGASIGSIVRMLSAEFILLVAIAFSIAVPAGFYVMEKWLANFAYKIDLNLLYFVPAGLLTFLIAWLTVGFEAVRAALSDPVKALKTE